MNEREAAEFFERSGLRVLTEAEEIATSKHYQEELIAGLEGKPSSVAMLPSGLSEVKPIELKEGAQALVLEIGGTNLYGARVVIRGGKPQITDSHISKISNKEFESPEQFYETVVQGLGPVLEGEVPDAVGVVYSFPGQVEVSEHGVDVISPEKLSKGFVIPGISKEGVGKALRRALKDTILIPDDIPTVVLNDTVAVLFSVNAKLGGVVGTGFNLATSTPKGVVNTESGGFALRPTNRFVKMVDEASAYPGRQQTEKQVSGLYLGEQMKLVVGELQQGESLPINQEEVDARTISDLLEYRGSDQGRLMLKEAAERFRDRSAQIVGLMVGTIPKTFPELFPEKEILVPIEGSLFWGMPDYSLRARETAERISGKQITFINVVDAGRLGAAVAALGYLH